MTQKELFKLINETIIKHIDNMCLNESIQKAINEELGISNEIVQTAQRIKDTIINNYRDLKPNRIRNGIKYYSNTIQVEAFETPLVIIYTISSNNCRCCTIANCIIQSSTNISSHISNSLVYKCFRSIH